MCSRKAPFKVSTALEALRLRPRAGEDFSVESFFCILLPPTPGGLSSAAVLFGSVHPNSQTQVDALDYERQQHGGVFGGDLEAGQVPAGQTVCASLMSDCYRWGGGFRCA